MTPIPLILPVETHSREFDAKFLLACVAAERGHPCFVGFQNEIRARINALPAGVFIAKGFASRKARFLNILKGLGHRIMAWDEEGLVHPVAEIYAKRRISPESLDFLDGVFSWGDDYSDLFRSLPFYDGTPLHQTGNPRLDLLGTGLHAYYAKDVAALHGRFGKYILFNSNFGRINPAVKRRRDEGVAGPGTSNPELDAKWLAGMEYRRALYQRFRVMLEATAKAFPDRQIVLRPHPSERIESWNDIRERQPNVHVLFEGNVIPWLLGAEILVHNGCTTAIESVLMTKPALCYQPIPSQSPDWELPNSVSHKALSDEATLAMIGKHLDGSGVLTVLPEHRAILARYADVDPARLCCDRVVDTVETLGPSQRIVPGRERAFAKVNAAVRSAEKRLRAFLPGDIYSPWHQRKQFPDTDLATVQDMLARMQSATGRFGSVVVSEFSKNIFKVDRKRTA